MNRWRILSGSFVLLLSLVFISAVYADTTYQVQYGDTLWRIGRRYNLTPAQIVAVNPKITNLNLIYVGDVLVIPTDAPPADPGSGTGGRIYLIQPGDNLFRLSLRYNTTVPAILAVNPQIKDQNWIYAGHTLTLPDGSGSSGTGPANPPATGTYVVQPGDGLTGIARRFNTTVDEILVINPEITNRHLIFVGDVIRLPGQGGRPEPIPNTGLEVGGETQTFGHAQRMTEIGMQWVKYEVEWQAGKNPADVAGLVQQAHGANFKVLLTITGAGEYPAAGSINYGAYTEFVRGVAGLGANAPDAIEIWDDQNIDLSWPAGEINPTNYVQLMLAPAYRAIKAANNGIMVISGAPSPTGAHNGHNVWADDEYMRRMAAAGAAFYADCIGVHYNAGATSPSAVSGHPGGSHYSWYFLPMITLYNDTFDGRRPFCFTRIGYLSPHGFPSVPGDFGWSAATTAAQQAAWLAESVTLAQAEGRPVRMMIIYNVDYTHYDVMRNPAAGFAIFRPDGSCPACDTLSPVIPRS
jgi:LysM repeat protein